jgi:hypothetical protein
MAWLLGWLAGAAPFLLTAILVGLFHDQIRAEIWRLSLRIVRSTHGTFDAEHPPPRELSDVEGEPKALVVALRLRRDAGDLRAPRLLRSLVTAGKDATPIARLWLPMAAGAAVLTIEMPLLLLVAMHLDDDGNALRGLALALALIIVVDGGPLALTTLSAASTDSGWQRQAIWTHALLVGLGSSALLALIWSDPLGNPLGFADPTWDAAREALRGLAIAPLLVALRRYLHGYVILARRTAWLVWATLARVMASVVLAALVSTVLDAGTFGIGLALTVGVAIEAGIVAFAAGETMPKPTRRGVPRIALAHLPLSGSTLLAMLPVSALLLALVLSDGSNTTFWAWLVVFIGPWLIASLTLDLGALAVVSDRMGSGATFGFVLGLGLAFAVLWGALAAKADIGGMPWLLPFPLLCIGREWLRGALVARQRISRTSVGVAAGSLTLCFAFAVGYEGGLDPVAAAALAISAGAIAEIVALALLSRPARAAGVEPAECT